MDANDRKPVLVTTAKRGVFFGYLFGSDLPSTLPGSVELADARNCIYWSTDTRGFLGLAAAGPNPSCRIGPKVPWLTLFDVTSLAICAPEAAQRWEESPWK